MSCCRSLYSLPIAASIALLACGGLCQAQVNVLTANGSNDRTNANLQEAVLSPATVAPSTFGKIGFLPVDGQLYAQVLYVSALVFPGLGVHDVVIACTMHNSVYAFDANPGAGGRLLWHVNLGQSVPSGIDINPEIGILSTGVIDPQRRVVYVVAETLENGAPVFSLHALDLISGAERLNGPVAIAARVAGAGTGNEIEFDASQHLQRPGLLLANGSVYIAFGSHADQPPWHGWILSYDASDLTRQTGVLNTTPSGSGGAVWQSGRGLAADDAGNLYAISGNGDYDGVQNFGESFLRLPGSLGHPSDWFTPPEWLELSDGDADLSAGPALISGTHLLIGADKNGNLYEVNGDSMGHVDGNGIYPAGTGYIFNLAVWSQPNGATVYLQSKFGPLESFAIDENLLTASPLSSGGAASITSRVGLTLSANGADPSSGILWEFTEASDGSGTLHAFNASNLAQELWNSDMNTARDALGVFAKFVSPTVVNGRVYAPTFSNGIVVYGLVPSAPPAVRPLETRCAAPTGLLHGGGRSAPASDPDGRCATGSGRNRYLE
jgi:hypothetical protein